MPPSIMQLVSRLRNPSVRLVCSYVFDWALCLVLLVLFFLLDRFEPIHREFSVQNTAIMYQYKEDKIPTWSLVLIAFVLPMVVIAVVGLGVRRSPYDVHNGILGLLVSLLLTTMFTQVIKGANKRHSLGSFSAAFAGLFYLSLWLAGKMHIFDRRGYSLKGVILIAPIFGALLVAITRVQDSRHAGIDVTWGSIIGIIFATFAYHQYYPVLTAKRCHIPHPPRDFSHLAEDSQGRTESTSHLEQVTGIRPNDDFVDESKPSPQALHDLEAQNGDLKTETA
ncbi:hypothetical protein EC968_008964 [Mortierella alpina]|nr:hypothetical protein EC968_008964 [Mortierella alpina]